MSNRLVRALRRAHAIEIGAYHAYEGHWRSLKKDDPARAEIQRIQREELFHKKWIRNTLKSFGAKPSIPQDALMWTIGNLVSISCLVMGRKAALRGASFMETIGAVYYGKLARVAYDEGHLGIATHLEKMEDAETEHWAILEDLMRPQG